MIIDFHTHIFPNSIAQKTVSALEKSGNVKSYSDGTEASLVEKMREAGVDIAVNLPVLTRAGQFDSILKFAIDINSRYSKSDGKRIISFAGMHPDIEDYKEKLLLVKESGILGIKIHPDYQGCFFDDEKYVRILSEAKRLGLITVTHAGFDCAYVGQPIRCTPKRVMSLLDKIGGYDRLVLAHMGANQLFDEVYDTLAGEDVYFDTACVLNLFTEEKFKKILDKHGDGRILFATDSPWRDLSEDVSILKGFSLSCEERIFSENAARLLNL